MNRLISQVLITAEHVIAGVKRSRIVKDFLGIHVTVTTVSWWKAFVDYAIIERDIEMLGIVVNSDKVYYSSPFKTTLRRVGLR